MIMTILQKINFNHMTDKEIWQYSLASIGFFSGIVLCSYACMTDPNHSINGSVLGYMGEMLSFVFAVFGLSAYIKNKYIEMKNIVKSEVQDDIDAVRKDIDNRLKPVDDLLQTEK